MTFKIKLVKFCKREKVLGVYESTVAPLKGELVELNGIKYLVSTVRHVVVTLDKGSSNEVEYLNHIEVELLK